MLIGVELYFTIESFMDSLRLYDINLFDNSYVTIIPSSYPPMGRIFILGFSILIEI